MFPEFCTTWHRRRNSMHAFWARKLISVTRTSGENVIWSDFVQFSPRIAEEMLDAIYEHVILENWKFIKRSGGNYPGDSIFHVRVGTDPNNVDVAANRSSIEVVADEWKASLETSYFYGPLFRPVTGRFMPCDRKIRDLHRAIEIRVQSIADRDAMTVIEGLNSDALEILSKVRMPLSTSPSVREAEVPHSSLRAPSSKIPET